MDDLASLEIKRNDLDGQIKMQKDQSIKLILLEERAKINKKLFDIYKLWK